MISLQSYEPGALRVPLKSPVRENRTPGSVRGRPGNRAFLPRYDTRDGRWLSRDPIGERGGLNLYAMLHNCPVLYYDFLGTAEGSFEVGSARVSKSKHGPKGKIGYKVTYTPADECSCAPPDQIILVQAISFEDFNKGWSPHMDRDPTQYKEQKAKGGQPLPKYPGRSGHNAGQPWITDSPGVDDLTDDNLYILEVCALCRHTDSTGKVTDRNLGCIKFNFGNKSRLLNESGFKDAEDPTDHWKDAEKDWNRIGARP